MLLDCRYAYSILTLIPGSFVLAHQKKVERMSFTTRLSVFVPAYNEEDTIVRVLRSLLKEKDVFEVIMIDDASTDKTFTLASSVKDKRIRVIRHRTNQGKGKAIQTVLTHATGNYVSFRMVI